AQLRSQLDGPVRRSARGEQILAARRDPAWAAPVGPRQGPLRGRERRVGGDRLVQIVDRGPGRCSRKTPEGRAAAEVELIGSWRNHGGSGQSLRLTGGKPCLDLDRDRLGDLILERQRVAQVALVCV